MSSSLLLPCSITYCYLYFTSQSSCFVIGLNIIHLVLSSSFLVFLLSFLFRESGDLFTLSLLHVWQYIPIFVYSLHRMAHSFISTSYYFVRHHSKASCFATPYSNHHRYLVHLGTPISFTNINVVLLVFLAISAGQTFLGTLRTFLH